MINRQLSTIFRYPQVYKKITCDAGPIAGVSAVFTLACFIITAILATEGLTTLAAFSFITLFDELMFVCVGELNLVATSFVGLAGESDSGLRRSRSMLFNTALLSTGIVGLITCLSLWTTPFLTLIGQSAPVADLTGEFLPFFLFAAGLRLISRMLSDLYVLHEKSHQALVVSVGENVGVCLLGFVSIKHGLPYVGSGLAGLVYGKLFCNALALLTLSVHGRYYHRFPEMVGLLRQKISKKDMAEALYVGGPMMFQQVIEMGAIVVSSMMMGLISVKAVVARHIAHQYTMNLAVPVFAFADASSILVSQQLGRGRMINAYKLTLATVSLAFLLPVLLLSITPLIKADWIMALFKVKEMHGQTAQLTFTMLQIQFVVLALDGIRYPLVSTLRSYRDTLVPCLWTLFSLGMVGPSFSYFSGVKQHVPAFVLWGEAVGIAVGLTYILPRWRKAAFRHLRPVVANPEQRSTSIMACMLGSAVYPELKYVDPDSVPASFQDPVSEDEADREDLLGPAPP